MTYVMSKLAYKNQSASGSVSDVQILAYVNQMMGLRGTFTKLQVK